jgi:hypothetical protein
MQHATAYEWHGRIFLHPDSRTTTGLWVGSEPNTSSDPGDPVKLGRAVLLALSDSKEGVPHPSIWEDKSALLRKFAGAKSFRDFFGSARCVSIKLQNDLVTFTPYRNLGSRDGYVPIKGKDRSSPPSAPELGAALLSAFEDTE